MLGLRHVGVQVQAGGLGELGQQGGVGVGVSGIGGSGLTGHIVGRGGGPIQLLSGGGQEGSQLEGGILLRLGVALGRGDDQGRAGHILVVVAGGAVGLVRHTDFEGDAVLAGLSGRLVGGVHGGGVQAGSHVAGGEVQHQGVAHVVDDPLDVALVDPLAQLLDQLQRGVGIQAGGVGLGVDHVGAHVGEHAVEVGVIGAVHGQGGLAGGGVDGLEERFHVFHLGGEGQVQLVQQGLVVVEDLAGLTEGDGGLMAVVVHHVGHALIEIVEVDFVGEGGDIGGQVFNQSVLGIGGQARHVDDAQGGHANLGSVGRGQLGVDHVIAADVLSVDLDAGVRGFESGDLLGQLGFVITGEGVPEGDFGAIGDGGIDFSHGDAAQQHQHSQNQRQELLHESVSSSK